MARVLVTGGAGFIGSHLTDRLVDEGHHVTVLDDLSTGKLANLERVRDRVDFVEVDITAPAAGDAVERARPDVLFHLAAQIDVRRSVADPVADAMVNVIGTVRLLEACRRIGTAKFVLTSSGGTIYGEPPADALPVAETYGGHPTSPYGASKRGAEEYLHVYAALYGLSWSSLALANVYGPRQDPHGEAGVVSIFGGLMLAGQPVTIFGDGKQTRDFVYVGDVVDAYLRAIEAGDDARCNIGTGEQTSVNALFGELAELAGYDRRPDFAPARPGELAHAALDSTRAADLLGWRPHVSLRSGLAATLDWLRSYGSSSSSSR